MSDDQEQGQGGTESQEGNQTSADNQENQDQNQSDEGQGKDGESKQQLYKTPDGRELPADQLAEEYGKLNSEFTKRSQKLSDYERKEKEAKEQAELEANKSVQEKLKNVPPDVKEAILGIVKPVITNALTARERADAQRKRDEAFEKELSAMEKEFPGGDGKPKFDRSELIESMRKPDNRNFDPRSKFFDLKRKEFIDYENKQAMKGKSGGTSTERTGQSGARKPDKKSPRTLAEARKAAMSRVR